MKEVVSSIDNLQFWSHTLWHSRLRATRSVLLFKCGCRSDYRTTGNHKQASIVGDAIINACWRDSTSSSLKYDRLKYVSICTTVIIIIILFASFNHPVAIAALDALSMNGMLSKKLYKIETASSVVIDIFVDWRDFAGLEYRVKHLENVADLKSVVVYSGYTEVWRRMWLQWGRCIGWIGDMTGHNFIVMDEEQPWRVLGSTITSFLGNQTSTSQVITVLVVLLIVT